MKWIIVILAILIILPAVIVRADILTPDAVQQAAAIIQQVSDLPLKITIYNPELGGINCMAPCDTYANGQKVLASHFYNGYSGTAACPHDWLNRTVVIEGVGEFVCKDRGGSILVRPNYINIDILSKTKIDCPIIKDIGEKFAACLAPVWGFK